MWLVLDTAGPVCAAGLFEERSALAQRSEDIGRGHAERLMALIADVMGEAGAGWGGISHIAITCGPGSFTGLRVGLAAARGFGLALGVPVYGVSVLDALAQGAETDQPFTLALPAGRGEVWCAAYDEQGLPVGAPWSVAQEAFSPPAGFGPVISPPSGSAPLGSILAVAQRQPPPDSPPSALYLRAPDAKPQAAVLRAPQAV